MAIKSLLQQLKTDFSGDSKCLIPEVHRSYTLSDTLQAVYDGKAEDKIIYIKLVTKIIERSPWQWISDYMNTILQDQTNCTKVLCDVVSFGQVPVLKDMEHYRYDRTQFSGVAVKANGVMSLVYAFLDHIDKSGNLNAPQVTHFIIAFVPKFVILFLEQFEENWWSSSEACVTSNQCIDKLQRLFEVQTLSDLIHTDPEEKLKDCLFSSESTLLCRLLKQLNQILKKETWKKYPASHAVFYTCLKFTKSPHLSDHLNKVLPPSLFFTDDYILDNKILGVKCLHRIISEVSREELRWYGRAEVVYETLKHQLYTREASMIEILHPALLAILDAVEKHSTWKEKSEVKDLPRYNEVLEQILLDAEGEQNITMRRALTKNLELFVDRLGINSVKHMTTLLRLISSYLEIPDGANEIARQNVLQLLQKVLEVTWPRVPSHSDNILNILVKFLIDVTMMESDTAVSGEVEESLVSMTTNCLVLLKFADQASVEEKLKCLCDLELPDACLKVVRCVIDAQQPEDISSRRDGIK